MEKNNKMKIQNIITKDMRIDEIVNKYPQSVDVLLNYGLHCIGCSLAGWETIEQGAQVHGFNKKTIDHMLKELNEYVKESEISDEKDTSPIKIPSRALKQVETLMKLSKGSKYLRIALVEMPFGYRYGFKFEKRKKKTDAIINKDNVTFIIDKKDHKKMKGSTMDYLKFLPGNGFKIYAARKNSKIPS